MPTPDVCISRRIYGRQFAIDTGFIDLLAENCDTGDLVVIELKKDESDHSVISQISWYLGWVQENLAKDGQKVTGIVCAFSATDRLKLAAKPILGLEVFEYDLRFVKA